MNQEGRTKGGRYLGVFSLVMITIGSVDSIRNLPAAALFGSSIVAFFLIAAIFFLLPSALISAQLASRSHVGEGGVYRWVSEAFGAKAGFLAVWFQWIENVIYYPALLAYIAGTVAYLINPALVHSKGFMMSFILIAFWAITFLNLFGMKSSSIFANICALFGLVLPMALIIAMGISWGLGGHPMHVDLHPAALIPTFAHNGMWVALTGVMLSMCGMEIATIHVRETKNPQKTFPRALAISVVFILITLILGSIAIAVVIPAHKLSLVAGIMQTFSYFFAVHHMSWLLPVTAVILFVGGIGGVNNWLIAPTRGLHFAGTQGHMPKWLLTENRHGAPRNLLIAQAIIVSVCLVAFVLLPSINASYWYLNVLAAQLYMFMYIAMFAAGIALRARDRERAPGCYQIPGGRWGTYIVGGLGIVGSVVTVVIGFESPGNIKAGSALHYALIVFIGLVVMSAPVFIFNWYYRRQQTLKFH